MKLFKDTKLARYDKSFGLTYQEFQEEQIQLAIEKYYKSATELRRKWGFFYDQSHVKFIYGVYISQTGGKSEKCPTDKDMSYAQFCMHAWYFLKTRQLDAYEALCIENDSYPRRLALPIEKSNYSGICTDLIEPDNQEYGKYFFEAVAFIDKPNLDELRVHFTESQNFSRTCSYYLDILDDELYVSNKPLQNLDVDFYIGVYNLTSDQRNDLMQKSLVVGQEMPFFIGHVNKVNSKEKVNTFKPCSYHYAYPLPVLVNLDEHTVEIDQILKSISNNHYIYANERKEKGLLKQAEEHHAASKLIMQNVLEYKNFVEKNRIINHCNEIADYISRTETLYYDI